ncbi:MAG: hypothetical protein ACE14S_12885, partial [Candidatus Bathyarchaeia archaeon]
GASLGVPEQQAQANLPPPPPPPPSSHAPVQQGYGETILGVMLLRKPKSMGRYDSYTGIVTSQRMVFAQMTGDMLKDSIQAARDQAKAEGKGFWGQWEEQLRASFTFTQRYLTMDPAAALTETPGNFAVDNSATREVKLRLKDINKGAQTHMHEFELEISSNTGTCTFRMDKRDEYVQLLKRAYGERVKTPLGYLSSHGVEFRIGP